MSLFVSQAASECDFPGSDSWVILSPVEQSIKRKIEAVGTPLKDWDIQINYGIKTGYNDAFIITTARRDEILAACRTDDERARTAELIRPILRGRDIKRYGYEWAGLWLIATFPSRHYDIEQYPAVKDFLLTFGIERLEQTGKTHIFNGERVKARKKNSHKWFETQDPISYWGDFSKQKIVWSRLMRISKNETDNFPRFCSAEAGIYVVDSLCFFTGKDIDKLCKILNSTYAAYYFFRNIAILDDGGMQMRQQYVEEIPIPHCLINKVGVLEDDDIFDAFSFSDSERCFISNYVTNRYKEISASL